MFQLLKKQREMTSCASCRYDFRELPETYEMLKTIYSERLKNCDKKNRLISQTS